MNGRRSLVVASSFSAAAAASSSSSSSSSAAATATAAASGSVGKLAPAINKPTKKCKQRRIRLLRAQGLRMLSQNQSELEPGASTSSAASSSSSSKDNNPPGGGGMQLVGLSPEPSGSGGGAGSSSSQAPVTPGAPFHNGEGSEEFLSTGRTGRRNALHDILGEHAETATADLPEKLGALTTDPGAGPSTSGTQQHHTG
ncbi:hormone receptor 4-like isoform X2 [Trichogramma pretiosum]|nr:hormone receptor 4-like isoform X2 [Trichogramma pretiosum]